MKKDTKTIKALEGKFFNKITIKEEVNIPPEIINHLRQKWQEELRKKIENKKLGKDLENDLEKTLDIDSFNQAIQAVLDLLK